MTDMHLYINSVILLLPACSAITCLLLLHFSLADNTTMLDRRLKRTVTAYYAATVCLWISLFCYAFFPAVFVRINVLLLLSYMLVPILFYRIIFIIAEDGCGRRFSRWHYAAPLLLSAVLAVWCLAVPYETTLLIVEQKGRVIPEGYEAYFWAFTSKQMWHSVTRMVYFPLTVYILYRYYRSASQPESLVRKPTVWIKLMMALSAVLLLNGIIVATIPKSHLTVSMWVPAASLIAVAQHLLLTYHIIRHSYRLYVVAQPEKKPDEEKPLRREHRGTSLTRKSVEEYFRKEKPWLNPAFRITDMVEHFDLNRSVISAFINNTYGVNFNRYLNRRRLKELNCLQKLTENRDKTTAQLLAQAGFSNGKHYLRALRAEEHPEDKEGGSE